MKYALHPFLDEEISVTEYFAEFGGRYDLRWAQRERPRSRCPGCYDSMSVIGEDRPEHDRVFGHMPNKQAFCPLKNLADVRYELLPDTQPDPAKGKLMRAHFFAKYQQTDIWLREHWLRFWFDARLRTIDDLWVRTEGDFTIIKTAYKSPQKGGNPNHTHLVFGPHRLQIDIDFLRKPYILPNSYQLKQFKTKYPQECNY